MKCESKFTIAIAIATATLAILIATTLYAPGQVLARIAQRNRIFRLQGI